MTGLAKVLGAAAFALVVASPASALTMRECSAKFNAAKAGGGTMTWNDYRKAECGPDAKPLAPAAAATPAAKVTNAVFPKAVDKKYASEKPGRARLKTCSDQYNANKTANANGGLKWIQKGGGYWSQCSKALKGNAA